MAGAEAFSAVHSARSASIGSVAAALTAGIAHAIRATASRRVIAHAKRTRLWAATSSQSDSKSLNRARTSSCTQRLT